MIIEEYEAKSLVRTSKTSLFSWAEVYLNPYQGCYHDCVYCDGKSEGYYMHDDFGTRIKVKKNAPDLLEQYLRKRGFFPINRERTSTLVDYYPNLRKSADTKSIGKFVLFIGGGVCDVYQPAEEELKMTRRLLEIADDYRIPVCFLTKSDLILRDLDLLKKINQESFVSASFTITLADEETQKIFEPNASTTNERFAAIKKLRKEGIHSGVYCYPSLPFIGDTDQNIETIYKRAKEVEAEFIYCWGLTLKPGRNKNQFMNTVQQYYPDLYHKYKKLYGNEDKFGNLDRAAFDEFNLIWPEVKGYKYGYELGLDYTSERYVPDGRIENNLKIAELLHRLAYLKSFFIKSSKYETRQLNTGAKIFNELETDVALLNKNQLAQFGIDKIIYHYIEEFLNEGKSAKLKNLEQEAYDSVYRYLESKNTLY